MHSAWSMATGRCLALLATLGVACTVAPADPGAGEKLGQVSSPIVGGVFATDYPEAALVDLLQDGQQFAACSGTVIAPWVVLTAGHCITAATDWRVTTPYAPHAEVVHAIGSAVFDYELAAPGESVDPSRHDIGLLFLDNPVALSAYPALTSQPLPFGAEVVNVGRVQDGALSSTDLFVGPPVQVSDASPFGYPFDYGATGVIESGDSGGPAELADAHVVVAVNSGGAGGDVEVLARVDLIYDWIEGEVAAHGGGGSDAGLSTAYEGTDGNDDASVDDMSAAGSWSADPQASSPRTANPYGCSASGSRPTTPVGFGVLAFLALLTAARLTRSPAASRAGGRRTPRTS